MRHRLRQFVQVLVVILVTVVTGVAAVYLTGPNGLLSCVPSADPASPDRLPRWLIAAGVPALITALVGSFFALAAEYLLTRLIGLALAFVLAAGTFYAVYTYLPAACRP